MQDTLRSKPGLTPAPPALHFDEPAPNRFPLHFLLLLLGLPLSVISFLLTQLAKLLGFGR